MKPLSGILGILWLALLLCAPASALEANRSFAQYKYTRWTVDDGAPPVIGALAQGDDGYLWIGARDGLFRFDGITFENIGPPPKFAAQAKVSALAAARDGTLWVGYKTGGVAVYRNGALQDAALPNPGAYVISITQRADGDMWALLGRPDLPLARYHRGRWQEIGDNWNLPSGYLVNMVAMRDGSLWVAALQAIYVLRSGSHRFERVDVTPTGHASLSDDGAGRIWMSDDAGSRVIRQAGSNRGSPATAVFPTPGFPRATRSFFDRNGNLWGSTGREGIFRVSMPSDNRSAQPTPSRDLVEHLTQGDHLASNLVTALIEDREGNIWVGSSVGLERFRDSTIKAEPALTKLPAWAFSLFGASDGTVYVGQRDSVYRIPAGGRPEPLIENSREAEAICEGPDQAVWIVLQDRIVRVRGNAMTAIDRPPMPAQGVYDCAVDKQNRLWLSGNLSDSLRVRIGNHWMSPVLLDQPRGPQVMLADRNRRLFIYYADGPGGGALVRMEGQRFTVLRPHKDAGLERLYTIYQGPHDLLLGGLFGIARLRGTELRYVRPARVPAVGDTVGLVQTPEGATWLLGRLGIASFATSALEQAFEDPGAPLRARVYDWRDGLPGGFINDGKHDAVRGGDGRLWFATTGGVVWLDPARLTRNAIPPPVSIGAVITRDGRFRDPRNLEVSAGTSSFEFDFAAPSLTIPERVQIRYTLEGADHGWVDPGMRRQAFYTNLAPGHYVFRVIAANNDGVWNRTGATLAIDIPPTFLQSKWFVALCLGGAGLLLWAVYRIRVRQLTSRVRERLEGRLAERERIARDLHDTLLQGFQGLILRFQSVTNEIPEGSKARGLLGQALDRADRVLSEGRDSVRVLRTVRGVDLTEALAETAQRMRVSYPVEFTITVEGAPCPLHPVVRDEVSRIGEEAIINAFQHGRAHLIEVAIAYDPSGLRLGIRDDGVGMAAEVFASGRQGHFGLIGMRERAQQIDSELTVSSRPGSGTEIRLIVPGKVAYVTAPRMTLRQRLAIWVGLLSATEGRA